jgi:glycosyltransferase involved in cell wall biosynthesis
MEGLSVTLVEALACGIPVVATAVGAHPDILRDHENAVLVKVRDPISLAQGLLCLLTDRELAEKVSRGGRILFEERLEIGCIESEFHDVYESLFRRPVESVR